MHLQKTELHYEIPDTIDMAWGQHGIFKIIKHNIMPTLAAVQTPGDLPTSMKGIVYIQ